MGEQLQSSEQVQSDVGPTVDDLFDQPVGVPPTLPSSTPSALMPTSPRPIKWIAPAWFLLGIIVGAVAFAIYFSLSAKPAPAATLDATAMRGAARQGVLDAIATLNAPNNQPSSQGNQAPVVVDPSKFTVRASNRTGNPGAKVTVIEFSDFQ